MGSRPRHEGDAFLTYLREILGPSLAKGDVVIKDNLSAHKVASVKDAIEATGAKLLYLPPYSPDLNPIALISPRTSRDSAFRPASCSR